MSLCLHFHNYVDISQLAFQGRPVPNLSLIHPAHGLPLPSLGTALGTRDRGEGRPGPPWLSAQALLPPLSRWPPCWCLSGPTGHPRQGPGQPDSLTPKGLARGTALSAASPGWTHPPLLGQSEAPRVPLQGREGTRLCGAPTAARCWH